jgi:dephospho-CoA kinase
VSLQVVDVPLLFEGGLDRFTSMNITVVCDANTQRWRLMARDNSQRAAAEARIAAQVHLAEDKCLFVHSDASFAIIASTVCQCDILGCRCAADASGREGAAIKDCDRQ